MKPESCQGCALFSIGTGFVQPEWNAERFCGLAIIGEAAGEAEAREGLPFRPHAQSGSLLADALREANISRAEVAISNCLACHPPKDWLIGAPWEFRAIGHCTSTHLKQFIDTIKPKVILAVGSVAFSQLTERPKGRYGMLEFLRGYALPGAGVATGIPVIGTWHPAFLRRGMAHLIPLLQRDLKRAFNIATGRFTPTLRVPDDLKYQVAPTLEEAWNYAHTINAEAPLAFDIETPLSTRSDEDERTSFTDRDIKLFQCTQQRGSGIALPFRDEFIGVIRAILEKSRIRVGFNNWNFDDPVLQANGIDVGVTDDAMVMFGVLQPDLPKNLQAAAQFCGFQFPWKSLSDTDLAFYGCCDVDATLTVYETAKRLLEESGGWEAYQRYFKGVWPILRDMSRRGIPIDEGRRLELAALIEREDKRVTEAIQPLVPDEVKGFQPKAGYKRVPKSVEGLVEAEFVIEKEEKCQCKKKVREACLVCKGTGIVPVGFVVRRWAERLEFNPNSSHQVKRLVRLLKHPVPKHPKRTDSQGEASETTEVKELERLFAKTKHSVYPLLIQKRQLTKVEGTYVEGWKPSKDSCVHTTYTFQTATWQTSSRAPNVQNGLKHGKSSFQKELATAFNTMQHAQSGRVLVNFDFKSFHALTTAHDFNIPDYARLARIDIHSFVTCHYLKLPERVGLFDRPDQEMKNLFGRMRQTEPFKFTRDYKAKRTILGIQFGMGFRKLYQLNRDDFENESEAKVLWEMVYGLFPRLRKAQEEVKQRAAEDKKLTNKFGATRHFYDVVRWDRKSQKWAAGEQAEQAVAFLPASHAFGHFRDVLLRIRENGWDERFGLTNQVHDSMVFHCPLELVEECKEKVLAEMQKPSGVLVYSQMAPGGFQVDAEAAEGQSMAEMH